MKKKNINIFNEIAKSIVLEELQKFGAELDKKIKSKKHQRVRRGK